MKWLLLMVVMEADGHHGARFEADHETMANCHVAGTYIQFEDRLPVNRYAMLCDRYQCGSNRMIRALIGPVTGLLDKFIEDKDQRRGWRMSRHNGAESRAGTCQLPHEINKAEVRKHCAVFVAGWRPFRLDVRGRIGVAFCAGTADHLCMRLCAAFPPDLPTFDMSSLPTVLMGMCWAWAGLQTLRRRRANGLSK